MDFEQLKSLITATINDAEVFITDLTGTKDHLGITIVSDEFKDISLIKQHRIVMDILKQKLSEDLHAVQLKTLTFEAARTAGLIKEG
ncbi:MAG: BolA/IbaG family iron-sulfur metabolism protein [Bacteriovoracaceae bacterium]